MSGPRFAGKVVLVTGGSSGLGPSASSEASYITGVELLVDGGRVSF